MNRISVEAKITFEVAENWIDPSDQISVDWLYQTLKDSTSIYNIEADEFVNKGSVEVTDLVIYHTTKLERSNSAE